MAKKISLLLVTTAVAAFSAPAFASAAAVTDGFRNLLEVGTLIKGTSKNTVTHTEGLGTLTCKTVEGQEILNANTGSFFEMEWFGSGTASTCFDEGFMPIQITESTLLSLEGTGIGSASVSITFVADLPTITCHFEGTVSGTYSPGSSVLSTGGTLEGGPCGEAEFTGDFTLSQVFGGSVVLD